MIRGELYMNSKITRTKKPNKKGDLALRAERAKNALILLAL